MFLSKRKTMLREKEQSEDIYNKSWCLEVRPLTPVSVAESGGRGGITKYHAKTYSVSKNVNRSVL